MPATYKIEQLGGKILWEGDESKGDFPSRLSGDDREILLFHDSSSDFDPPKVGQEVYGDIDKDKRGNFRLKRKPKPKAGGGGGRSGGGGVGYEDPPIKAAKMGRAHAQEMAISAADSLMGKGLFTPENEAAYFTKLKSYTDAFYRDVQSAAPVPSQPPLDQSSSDAPADTTGLNEPQKTSDDSIPF